MSSNPHRLFSALTFALCVNFLFSSGTASQTLPSKAASFVKNALERSDIPLPGKSRMTIFPIEYHLEAAVELYAGLGTDPCTMALEIGFGQTINGSLFPSDCRLNDGSYADFYVFDGIAGQQVTIDLISDDFDAYTGIANELEFVLEDDDSGGGTNARITATLPHTGPYAILANSALPGEFGSYRLTLSRIPPCSFSLSPPTGEVPGLGGSFVVTVNTDPGCYWTAVSNSHPYIRLLDNGNLQNGVIHRLGSGTIVYSVGLNDTGAIYTGSLGVAGQTFMITQPSLVCSYSLSDTNLTMPGAESRGQITVNAPQGCPWTLRNNDFFIGFDSPAVLSNNRGAGTVNFYVIANNGPAARVGTATVAGQTLTITQTGLNCSYSLPITTITAPAVETTGTFRVNTQNGCTWGIGGNGIVQFPAPGGSGSTDVFYRFSENFEAQPRTVVIPFHGGGVENIPVTFTQAGHTPTRTTVSGRIIGPTGVGLRGIRVALSDADGGNTRTVATSSFGHYSFDNVMTGYGYLVGASSKRYRFSTRYELARANMPPVNFTGQQ